MPGKQANQNSATDLDAFPPIVSNRNGQRGDDSAADVRRNVEDRAALYRQQNAKTSRTIFLPLLLFLRNIFNIERQADSKNAIVPSAYLPPRSSVLDRIKGNSLPAGSSPHRNQNQLDHLYKKTHTVYQALRNVHPGKFTFSFLRLVKTDLDMVIDALTPLARFSHWEAVSILDSLCVARNKLAFAAALFDMEEVHPLYRLVIRNKMFLSARHTIQDVLLNWNLLLEHGPEPRLAVPRVSAALISAPQPKQELASFMTLKFKANPEDLTLPLLRSFRLELAAVLKIRPEEIYFLGYRPGSTDVLSGISSNSSAVPDSIPPHLQRYGLEKMEAWLELPTVLTFINCDDPDREAGMEIFHCLRDAQLNPWLQQKSIEFGEKIPHAIRRALEASTGFVFCFSNQTASPQRFYVWEVTQALLRADNEFLDGIYFIPVQIGDCEVPERILEFKALNWKDADSHQNLVRALRNGLRRQMKQLPVSNPPPAQ